MSRISSKRRSQKFDYVCIYDVGFVSDGMPAACDDDFPRASNGFCELIRMRAPDHIELSRHNQRGRLYCP